MPDYRVILDTDIGTDVDDILALTVLLNSPQAELLAVTCVYGDVALRAKIAMRTLQLRGVEVPVYCGASQPLLRLKEVYWEGHEGGGVLDDVAGLEPAPGFAPHIIAQTVLENPGEIHIIAIGPLTNLALALQEAPEIAEKVAGISMMGGVIRGNDGLSLPIAEHNINCDPHAAHVVFSSGAPITMTPLNITVRSRLTQAHVERIDAANTDYHHMLADQIRRYPRFARLGHTAPHDPLAVAALLHADVVETKQVSVQVEIAGRVSAGATHAKRDPKGNVSLVTAVDVEAFETLLIEKLAN
ncbi:MAG: nucleoside hydrolase [Chloroflexota bacterium]